MKREESAENGQFEGEHKEGVYKAIYERRDIRSQFRSDPIPEKVLARVLHAAHHAPSVGFMQPWNFIMVESSEKREMIKSAFSTANDEAVLMFDDEKREQYKSFKLEGIMEAPLNICVTCDRKRFGPVVIGRTANRIMDIFSSVCAVQNLWLAARAEGLGVGWVSILHNSKVTEILKLPAQIMPVAYLCIGYVTHFPEKPELEAAGWLPRIPLEQLVFRDEWGEECERTWPDLFESIASHRESFNAGSSSLDTSQQA